MAPAAKTNRKSAGRSKAGPTDDIVSSKPDRVYSFPPKTLVTRQAKAFSCRTGAKARTLIEDVVNRYMRRVTEQAMLIVVGNNRRGGTIGKNEIEASTHVKLIGCAKPKKPAKKKPSATAAASADLTVTE